MSITISGGGVAGITVETDPTALKLTGGTLSGKLFTSPTSGVAGFNIGTGGTDAGSTTAGDMWIATGGATLNFRDGLGAWRQCLNTNTAGIIQTTSTAPALRVTQMGNGEAFRVEDSTTPDTTAFVISNNGKVGIGVAPDSSACLRVDHTGIKFADGSTQTTSYSQENQQSLADSIWLAHNFRNCSLSGSYDSLSNRTTINYSHPVAEALINNYSADIEILNTGNGYPIQLIGTGFIEVNGDQTGVPLLLRMRGITLTGGEFTL
jgi:hypothetical protein